MKERLVRLVGQKQKLVSASFAKLQFWTGDKWHYFMNQKYSNEPILLDIRVLQDGLQAGEKSWGKGQAKTWLQYKSPS